MPLQSEVEEREEGEAETATSSTVPGDGDGERVGDGDVGAEDTGVPTTVSSPVLSVRSASSFCSAGLAGLALFPLPFPSDSLFSTSVGGVFWTFSFGLVPFARLGELLSLFVECGETGGGGDEGKRWVTGFDDFEGGEASDGRLAIASLCFSTFTSHCNSCNKRFASRAKKSTCLRSSSLLVESTGVVKMVRHWSTMHFRKWSGTFGFASSHWK
mmetsp:Transcript_32043/g.62660  ORF Transcript_32043/g.62660 Transcript_32043/m.62660 type:complete len:214 (-) Transcript_32043:192-833(-)